MDCWNETGLRGWSGLIIIAQKRSGFVDLLGWSDAKQCYYFSHCLGNCSTHKTRVIRKYTVRNSCKHAKDCAK